MNKLRLDNLINFMLTYLIGQFEVVRIVIILATIRTSRVVRVWNSSGPFCSVGVCTSIDFSVLLTIQYQLKFQ